MNKIYIKKSGIEGLGIFAKKDIKKDEILFEVKGRIIKDSYGHEAGYSYQQYLDIGPNWLVIAKNIWLSPYNSNPWRYINHSCQANAGRKGKTTIVAIQNIKKNEEITIDYSITEEDPAWTMKCTCQQKTCRKVIKSVQFLPKKLFLKYKPYMPRFMQKSYLKIRF